MYNRCKNHADAEDIIQEAYYRALKYSHTFEMGTPFNFWFNRIISNVHRDFIAERMFDIEELDEDKIEGTPDNLVPSQLWEQLKKEIEDNPNKEILTLYFIYGHPLREIVQITDCKYREANNLITYFKKKMREKYT